MNKKLKRLCAWAAAICWLTAVVGADSKPMLMLMILPGAVLMYISGMCYGCFYPGSSGRHYYRKAIKNDKR